MITIQDFKDADIGSGNCVVHDTVHNGGWYDLRGVKLGWGDLDPSNIEELRTRVGADDALLVLHESASYWKFVTDIKGPASLGYVTTDDGEKHPGIDYVMKHVFMVIHNNTVFYVDDREDDVRDFDMRGGVPVKGIHRDEMRKKLKKLIRAAKA